MLNWILGNPVPWKLNTYPQKGDSSGKRVAMTSPCCVYHWDVWPGHIRNGSLTAQHTIYGVTAHKVRKYPIIAHLQKLDNTSRKYPKSPWATVCTKYHFMECITRRGLINVLWYYHSGMKYSRRILPGEASAICGVVLLGVAWYLTAQRVTSINP